MEEAILSLSVTTAAPRRRSSLIAAGALSSAMAIFHLAIASVGAPAYRFFGALGLAKRAEEGSLFPGALTLGITLLFALFAFHAFAGARLTRPPPLLRTGLNPRSYSVPDNTIVVYRFVFDKLKLSSVPQQERLLFFALGHLANEINALNKQVLWCFKPDAEPSVVARAQVSLGLMYLRLLAGKLKEGYLLLQRHYLPGQPSLATVYDRCLLPDARNALTFLKRYFGKKNNVDTVRTHYSFHYSPEELEAGIALVPDDLELFVSQMQGNSFYYASEVLANQAMIRAVDADAEAQDVFGQLVQEIRDVAPTFNRVRRRLHGGLHQSTQGHLGRPRRTNRALAARNSKELSGPPGSLSNPQLERWGGVAPPRIWTPSSSSPREGGVAIVKSCTRISASEWSVRSSGP